MQHKNILSLSGGKDSTYLLFEIVRRGLPIDEAVFFDTGWEFPQMYGHLNILKTYCERNGIKFTPLYPENSFDYLMFDKPVQEKNGGKHNGYSWCGLCGCRWGTTEKIKALDKYCGTNNTVYVGIAAEVNPKNKMLPQEEKTLSDVAAIFAEKFGQYVNECKAQGLEVGL